MNITDFKNQVSNQGLSRGNRWRAFIYPPGGFDFGPQNLNQLSLYVSKCQIPTRDMSNLEFTEYGETRSLGVKHVHTDLIFTFYLSEDLRERKLFEAWQDIIFNPITKQHAYYDDYISRIVIRKYDNNWKHQESYLFNECYPTNIGGLEFAHEGDNLLEQEISFKFRNYERTTSE